MIASFTRELEKLMGKVHRVADDAQATCACAGVARGSVVSVACWRGTTSGCGPQDSGPALRAGRHRRRVLLAAARMAPTARRGSRRSTTSSSASPARYGALADTGSIVVVSGPGRGRIASLLPPVHIAVIGAEQLSPTLSTFLAANPAIADVGSNVVAITGPSRTGDIEGTLVLGVHGPGDLHVIVIG